MAENVMIDGRRLLLDDFFQVEEVFVRFELPGGRMSDGLRRLNLERGDSAAALVLNRDRRACILTRQFRYAAYKRRGQRWSVEVPAGVVEEHESPAASIRREILEEIGYRVGHVTPVATFFPSPGSSSERIHLFYAVVRDRDRIAPGGGSEADEDIDLLEIPLDDVDRYCAGVEVGDAKTMIALNWLLLRIARGEPLWTDDHE